MNEMYHEKNNEDWELLCILPRLCFIVLETLVDNQLTIRSRVVNLCNSAKVIVSRWWARR